MQMKQQKKTHSPKEPCAKLKQKHYFFVTRGKGMYFLYYSQI